MKYSELIGFEPIETVIQLREADEEDAARRLVSSYVISERMAEQITQLIIPNLQYDNPGDNKGLMIVGNYGTGKSHLMSVISAIAENCSMIGYISSDAVKKDIQRIAGKFKVFRIEIGSTDMPLREILCRGMENYLMSVGVDYTFKDISKVSNNKDLLVEMMAAFEEGYPEMGFLVVLDELLDYLRTRKEQELILDLNFLREVAEVSRLTRFRFISGVQETLFDNPKFQFVAETLRRVKDRFEQARIAREDVAYVVSQRLLKKDNKQKSIIRRHLEKFTPLYTNMNERIEEYVTLFPIHPAFIETFEKVYIAEKREILKILSRCIRKLMDKELPQDETGIVSYDVYWDSIRENPSIRSIPEIRDVLGKSEVLEDRIKQAYTRPQYRPAALRIIHALSVHRLTTGDIYSTIGATAEELKDNLCLYLSVPEYNGEFLKAIVETVLKEIMKTVNSQFISYNPRNEQYYLDLKKSIDYNSLIEQKAEGLSSDKLNKYYFNALARVMECSDSTYVPNFRIWEHEVEWKSRRAGRLGYLFFGAPIERSTAQPQRDFYLYFFNYLDSHISSEWNKQDEVFFVLREKSETFDKELKLYGASRELAAVSSGEAKRVYESHGDEHLKCVSKWLRDNLTTAFDVIYRGTAKRLIEWIGGVSLARFNIRDIINVTASNCLEPCFSDRAPEYPVFLTPVSNKNRQQNARDAIRWIAGGIKTDLGAKILDSLGLLEGNMLKPIKSKYVKDILEPLRKKASGHVLNRSEILWSDQGIEFGTRYRLEPEWVIVLLVSLVYSGDITLSIPGRKIDASNIDELTRVNFEDLINFKHVESPRSLPLNSLIALFEFMDIPEGLIRNPDTRESAIREIQLKAADMSRHVVEAIHTMSDRVPCFGIRLISATEYDRYLRKLYDFKSFLESLQSYNTVGRLKNFKYTVDEIKNLYDALEAIRNIKSLIELKRQVDEIGDYISAAELVMPEYSKWLKETRRARNYLMTSLEVEGNMDEDFKRKLLKDLKGIKEAFKDEYLTLHREMRLDAMEDNFKKDLMNSKRMSRLNSLTAIKLLPKSHLHELEERLLSLKSCCSLIKDDLRDSPICPHCGFNPGLENRTKTVHGILDKIEEDMEEIYREWARLALENITDPAVNENINLLEGKQKKLIEEFIKRRELPNILEWEFTAAVNNLLEGLEKVEISMEDIRGTLTYGGNPCTVDELRKRFEEYIKDKTKGKDESKIRIVLE